MLDNVNHLLDAVKYIAGRLAQGQAAARRRDRAIMALVKRTAVAARLPAPPTARAASAGAAFTALRAPAS
jgi:hypothetical protein